MFSYCILYLKIKCATHVLAIIMFTVTKIVILLYFLNMLPSQMHFQIRQILDLGEGDVICQIWICGFCHILKASIVSRISP